MTVRPFSFFASLALLSWLTGCGGSAPAPTEPAAATPPAPAPAAAPAVPTVESILEGELEATGGRAARDGLTTMVARGTLRVPALNLGGPLEVRMRAPRSMYTKVELGSLGSQEQGTNGEVVWEKSSITGTRILTGLERARILRTATFNAELLWRELYPKVELAGEVDYAGRPAWKLLATSPEGEVDTLYFDRETRLRLGSEAKVQTQMGEIPTATRIVEYGQFGPIKAPRKLVQTTAGSELEMIMESVEWNSKLPDDAFALPPDVQKLGAGTDGK